MGYLKTHGCRSRSGYGSWYMMMKRCYDPSDKSYRNYGGRGITVCDRWYDVENFFEDMGDRPSGLTLERIDNDGNYESSNCRWATRSEQQLNRRRRFRHFEYNGITDTVKGWAARLGISTRLMQCWLHLGCTVEDIAVHYSAAR